MEKILNKISRRITQPKVQGGSQAMLYATGLTEADLGHPGYRTAEQVAETAPDLRSRLQCVRW